ncbi:MAG: pyruvate formate lyase family protein, partial [Clostridia bacterium]|nr:pyruvate formate lyase family protein [Clostridia bacterium]
MLWNRYHTDRDFLDLYANPDFGPHTGVIERDEAVAAIASIRGSSHDLIKARACAFVLEHCAVDVNPKCWFGANFAGRIPKYKDGANRAVDQLSGKWMKELLAAAPEARKAMEHFTESGASAYFADFAHWVPDWDSVLRLGFAGLRDRARAYRAAKETLTQEQKDYYDSIEIMLTACIRFVGRLADLAQERIDADERMPVRVKCLRQLEQGAPRDIYEALQLIYLFHLIGQFCECAQVRSLGDIDRLLYPYYLRDLYAGTYTKEQVFELFQYFFLLYDFQKHAYNQPVSVGGTDIFGKTAFTELTDLILDAYFDAKLDNLKIHVFVSDNTPDSVLTKCMDMIRKGRGSFVFMNTKVGASAMSKAYHQPVEEWMLGSQGCYNFNLRGQPQHANQTRLNLPKAIELALFEGTDPMTGYQVGAATPPAEQIGSFDQFHEIFWQQMDHLIGRALVISDFYDENMAVLNPTPLMSSTFEFSL